MKYFIVADVHSYFTEMMQALDNAGFDSNNHGHIFVSLGDLLDRGDMPFNCLKFVNSLPNDRKILIRGNHEDLMEQAIARHEFLLHDWHNGTVQTACDLTYPVTTEFDVFEKMKKHEEYNKYIESAVDYYDDGKNIFVHGWIPCDKDDKDIYHARNQHYSYSEDWANGDWKQARWINGMDAWNQGVRVQDKTVYCGHWHTSWGHHYLHKTSVEWDNPRSTNPEHKKADFRPFVDRGIVALDACTAYTRRVNCYVVEV